MKPAHCDLRIAAVGDLHAGRTANGILASTLEHASRQCDVILLCGDLTEHGLRAEAELLADLVRDYVRVPVVAVLGNHDHESEVPEQVADALRAAGVAVLDGDCVEIAGVGFAGAKGYGGGFGKRTIGAWGEATTKRFVGESVNEARKLTAAVRRLTTQQKVVLTHYAPIEATIRPEPPEIHAFLGCSRLEEALDEAGVVLAFHGHAHYGALRGLTRSGVPVHNVSLPLLQRLKPGAPPVYLARLQHGIDDAQEAGCRAPCVD